MNENGQPEGNPEPLIEGLAIPNRHCQACGGVMAPAHRERENWDGPSLEQDTWTVFVCQKCKAEIRISDSGKAYMWGAVGVVILCLMSWFMVAGEYGFGFYRYAIFEDPSPMGFLILAVVFVFQLTFFWGGWILVQKMLELRRLNEQNPPISNAPSQLE